MTNYLCTACEYHGRFPSKGPSIGTGSVIFIALFILSIIFPIMVLQVITALWFFIGLFVVFLGLFKRLRYCPKCKAEGAAVIPSDSPKAQKIINSSR